MQRIIHQGHHLLLQVDVAIAIAVSIEILEVVAVFLHRHRRHRVMYQLLREAHHIIQGLILAGACPLWGVMVQLDQVLVRTKTMIIRLNLCNQTTTVVELNVRCIPTAVKNRICAQHQNRTDPP